MTNYKTISEELVEFDPIFQEEYQAGLDWFFNHDETNLKVCKIMRVTGIISLIGSIFILQDILRDPAKRCKTCNRVILMLCLMDCLYSFFIPVLNTLPVPKGQAYGAHGNLVTCDIQGFFGTLGFISSTVFNAALAVCYLLMVRYNWNETQFRRWWVQFVLFVLPLAYIPFGVVSTIHGGNNFNGTNCCGFMPYPLECDDKTIKCERGYKIKKWFLTGSQLRNTMFLAQNALMSIPIVLVCMILLFVSVFQQERANDRYKFGKGRASRERSKQVAMQGIFYVLAFLAVEIPWVVSAIYMGQGKPQRGTFNIVCAVTMPLQGLWNAMVYLRPRILKHFKTVSKSSRKASAGNKRERMTPRRFEVQQEDATDPTDRTMSMEHTDRTMSMEIRQSTDGSSVIVTGVQRSDMQGSSALWSSMLLEGGETTQHKAQLQEKTVPEAEETGTNDGIHAISEDIETESTEETKDEVSDERKKKKRQSCIRFAENVAEIEASEEQAQPDQDEIRLPWEDDMYGERHQLFRQDLEEGKDDTAAKMRPYRRASWSDHGGAAANYRQPRRLTWTSQDPRSRSTTGSPQRMSWVNPFARSNISEETNPSQGQGPEKRLSVISKALRDFQELFKEELEDEEQSSDQSIDSDELQEAHDVQVEQTVVLEHDFESSHEIQEENIIEEIFNAKTEEEKDVLRWFANGL